MRKTEIAMPLVGLIAGTRILLGIGLGLLLTDKFTKDQRHAVGWTLFLLGAGATIPLVLHVLSRRSQIGSKDDPVSPHAPATSPINPIGAVG